MSSFFPSIVTVSDVSVGYGSPQILLLTSSLAEFYQTQAMVFEPDESGKSPIQRQPANCAVHRVSLSDVPFSRAGRIEYVSRVAQELNRLRPEVLIIVCTFSLPVLSKLRYRPRLVIYASIESIVAYGAFDVELNRHLARRFDVIIFPEENRARLDSARCGFQSLPMTVIYNVSNTGFIPQPVPHQARVPRLLYSGTIDRKRTLADFFLKLQSIPVDLYGAVHGDDAAELQSALFHQTTVEVNYYGQLDADALAQVRPRYAYSIVMWAPTTENQLYACPNKFFEAIADGVPPITAPHPQCKMLVNRYQCGIVMRDWSFEAFQEACHRAFETFKTDRYAQMVENCRTAVKTELNWDAQFAKVKRLLPERL